MGYKLVIGLSQIQIEMRLAFLGSGPDRGLSPVERGDFLYVRLYVRPSVCPSVRTSVHPFPPARAQEPARQASEAARQASEPASQNSEPVSQAS